MVKKKKKKEKGEINEECTLATGAGAPAAVQEGLQAAETENIGTGLENMTSAGVAATLGMCNTFCRRHPDGVYLTMMRVSIPPMKKRRETRARYLLSFHDGPVLSQL